MPKKRMTREQRDAKRLKLAAERDALWSEIRRVIVSMDWTKPITKAARRKLDEMDERYEKLESEIKKLRDPLDSLVESVIGK